MCMYSNSKHCLDILCHDIDDQGCLGKSFTRSPWHGGHWRGEARGGPAGNAQPGASRSREIVHADMLARMPADMGPSSPLGFVTHGVVFEEGVAVKRFRSWLHGDERPHGEEPSREWQALNLLAQYAPGLAPEPIRAD